MSDAMPRCYDPINWKATPCSIRRVRYKRAIQCAGEDGVRSYLPGNCRQLRELRFSSSSSLYIPSPCINYLRRFELAIIDSLLASTSSRRL